MQYENYFDPAVGFFLREHERSHLSVITEARYRKLLKMSPQELLQTTPDAWDGGFYGEEQFLIAHLLAGTCECRRENFELLLPYMDEAPTRWDSFLTMYCAPPAIDSTPEEKKQVGIVLDILEKQLRRKPRTVQTMLLEKFLEEPKWSACDSEYDYEYAFERVKSIVEEEGLLPEYASKELMEFLVRRFPERFQDE